MAAPKGHANYDTEGLAGRPKIYDEEFINKQADGLLLWLKKDPNNIYFEEFLLDQDIHPKRMYEWIKVNQRFSDAYELAHTRQLQRLKKGTTEKTYDSSFVKFILINNHDYKEKTETKLSGDKDNPVIPWYQEASGQTKDLVNNDIAYPKPVDESFVASEQPILYSKQTGKED